MKYSDKKLLFEEFLKEWEQELSKVGSILNYLSSYKAIKQIIPKSKLIEEENLYRHQLEWVALCSQQTHHLEKKFFKKYWVPIEKDNYDFFLDLSKDPFKIFMIDFYMGVAYIWYYIPVGESVTDIMNSMNTDKSFSKLKSRFISIRIEIRKLLFEQSYRNGLMGEAKQADISCDSFFFREKRAEYRRVNNIILIKNVTKLIISLLPVELEVENVVGYGEESQRLVHNINGLVFLVTFMNNRQHSESVLRASFKDGDGYLEYSNNVFKIIHKDEKILSAFSEKYEEKVEEYLNSN